MRTIALTARSRAEDRDACLAAGMDDFLTKPLAALRLWAALDAVPADVSGASIVDARTLIDACGEDAEILESIAGDLRIGLPGYLTAVTRALKENQWPELRKAAHRLTDIVSPFSSAMRALSSELEDRAAQGDPEARAAALVERLGVLAPELMRQVDGLSLETLRRRLG